MVKSKKIILSSFLLVIILVSPILSVAQQVCEEVESSGVDLDVSYSSINTNLLNNQFAEVGELYNINIFMQFPRKINLLSCELTLTTGNSLINLYNVGDISKPLDKIVFNNKNIEDIKISGSTDVLFQINFPVEGEYLLNFKPNCLYIENNQTKQIDNSSMEYLGKFVTVLSSNDFYSLKTSLESEKISLQSRDISLASFIIASTSAIALVIVEISKMSSDKKIDEHLSDIKKILKQINGKMKNKVRK